MSKRILIAMFVLFCGCASQRVRVTVTRVHGEPAVSIEFEKKGSQHVIDRDDASTASASNVFFSCFK
jgi:hypothetical protein